MDDGSDWKCLSMYEASTRHLGTRSILEKIEGGMMNLYVWRNRHRGLT